jgi:two-component system NtrC family sensor kinase
VKRDVCDVNAMLRELVTRLPRFSEKTLEIDLKLTEFPLLVDVDRQKLYSVFQNIVGNAVDAITSSGQIQIATSRRIRETDVIIGNSEVIAVQISDSGSGIPEDQLARIFDPFFTTKAPGKGMGLGLSLCHRIIELLNGEITVESVVGQGTTMTVFLSPTRKSETIQPQPVVQPLDDIGREI